MSRSEEKPRRHVDDHGLSAAMNMAFQIFEQGSRRSGRTERMLAAVRDGDWIVTSVAAEARRIECRLKELGREKVRVIVSQPRTYGLRWEQGPNARGFVHFDHEFLTDYWRAKLDAAEVELDNLQAKISLGPPAEQEQGDMSYRFVDWHPDRRGRGR